jgi:hypothetical protein
LWGFDRAQIQRQLSDDAQDVAPAPSRSKLKLSSYRLQRRIMLALKKDIRERPHGKLIERIRYYCNVLLRE